LRFSEYIYAETAHARFCDTGDPAALDALIATLYRPPRRRIDTAAPDWDGDHRERHNPFLTDKYARAVARVDHVTKLMILTWYRSCGFFLQAEFPEMYLTASAKSGKKVKVFKSFMDMVDELSDSDVTKKEAVRESYLYDALGTINGIMRRQKELRQKYPNLYKK
jgi:hypothetical protein